ncbi:hypothetical protein Cgig2_022033 [Carnegiea gigantea]|uniref:Transcription factor MYB39 n=1 Tax=Carnegiea gigantea TaxID=171969 RepID=A0A9Q1KSS4_9CARY|nr:hypothetical protein Cgig2_022033 [Carnegiea gigantea]
MGRSPCCDDNSGLKKGPWTPEEDEKLISYIQEHGSHGSWRALPKAAGLNRCGKSCRLRWTNYLRPDIKRGRFCEEEEELIIKLHSVLGNKWSRIAAHLPGRTDNEIKNYWNTHIRKKLLQMGIDPVTHKPRTDLNLLANLSQLLSPPPNLANLINPWDNINNALRLQPNVAELAKLQVLQNIFQILNTGNSLPNMDQITPLNNPGLMPPHANDLLGNPSNPNPMCSSSQFGVGGQVPKSGEYSTWASMDTINCNNKSNLSSLDESRLPSLVNISPEPSTMNKQKQIESNTNSTNYGSGSSELTAATGDLFEGLEKLLDDDGNSDSFWKDFIIK